jgi:hypothetical protein
LVASKTVTSVRRTLTCVSAKSRQVGTAHVWTPCSFSLSSPSTSGGQIASSCVQMKTSTLWAQITLVNRGICSVHVSLSRLSMSACMPLQAWMVHRCQASVAFAGANKVLQTQAFSIFHHSQPLCQSSACFCPESCHLLLRVSEFQTRTRGGRSGGDSPRAKGLNRSARAPVTSSSRMSEREL